MSARSRSLAVALLSLTSVAVLTACNFGPAQSTYTQPSCSQLLSAAVSYERTGAGDIDRVLQSLSDSCSDEYEIAVDYLSNATNSEFRIDSCEKLLGYGARSESVELLEQNGYCTYGAVETRAVEAPAVEQWPNGGLGWDRARENAGTVQRVCGPLMSIRETHDGTFINIGRDYPSVDRFTIIFWGIYLEPIEAGVTICGSGEIYIYDGLIAQMEMWDPGALEIWR